jgi:hypothetical protein
LLWKSDGKNQLDDQGVDGRILLKWLLKNWDGRMECVDLAQDKEKLAGFCACGSEITV